MAALPLHLCCSMLVAVIDCTGSEFERVFNTEEEVEHFLQAFFFEPIERLVCMPVSHKVSLYHDPSIFFPYHTTKPFLEKYGVLFELGDFTFVPLVLVIDLDGPDLPLLLFD